MENVLLLALNGSTKIYQDDVDHGAPSNKGCHTFISKEEMNLQSYSQFDDDNDDSCFVRVDNKDSCFAGPCLQSPIQQMAFDPCPRNNYFLVIVSEDGDSPLIIWDATSAKTVSKVYQVEESAQEHKGGSAQSLVYAPPSAHAKPMLSMLEMDGHLLMWNLANSLSNLAMEWEILYCHALSMVKVEPGEGMASDAANCACCTIWGEVERKAVCLLPGKNKCAVLIWGGVIHVTEAKVKDTIVTMVWELHGKQFINGGRDGKLFQQMALKGDKILGELVRCPFRRETV